MRGQMVLRTIFASRIGDDLNDSFIKLKDPFRAGLSLEALVQYAVCDEQPSRRSCPPGQFLSETRTIGAWKLLTVASMAQSPAKLR